MCKKVKDHIKEYEGYVKLDLTDRKKTTEYQNLEGSIGRTNPRYTMA